MSWEEAFGNALYFARLNKERRRVFKVEPGVWTWEHADTLPRQ